MLLSEKFKKYQSEENDISSSTKIIPLLTAAENVSPVLGCLVALNLQLKSFQAVSPLHTCLASVVGLSYLRGN